MEYLGLLFEFLFLFAAIYVYMLCRGFVGQADSNGFIQKNKQILRILSIALIAVMGFNIFLHLKQLFA